MKDTLLQGFKTQLSQNSDSLFEVLTDKNSDPKGVKTPGSGLNASNNFSEQLRQTSTQQAVQRLFGSAILDSTRESGIQTQKQVLNKHRENIAKDNLE